MIRQTIVFVATFLVIHANPALQAGGAEPRAPSRDGSIRDCFQRAVFMLNLNPIPWEQVREEAEVIATALRPIDSATADGIVPMIDHFIELLAQPPFPPPDVDLPIGDEEPPELEVIPRDESARQMLVRLTRAVSALAVARLEQAAASTEAAQAGAALAAAYDAFAAFEPTLQACDPKALARLTSQWERLSELIKLPPSSEMSDGVRGEVGSCAEDISRYLTANFGSGFAAGNDEPFFPVPLASRTVNRSARPALRLPPGSRIGKPLPRPRQILNSVERGALEREMTLSSLGAAAFSNPLIFGEPARSMGISCNSCHDKSGNNPGFFIPGLSARPGTVDVSNSFFAPHGNNGVFDPLDIPDLRGIRFTAPYGRNGRFASLREFTRNVVVNEFNGDEPDPILLDAMVIYMNEFDFLRNPALNKDGTLNERAHEAALRGEKIFNRPFAQFGDRSCASCHIPSANFLDHKRHDIGTVSGYADFSRDRALDTPTLLGAAVTAPYFHDGSQPTLRSVVEWFDREFKLGLSEPEIADLTSYVSTVGNGVHPFQPGESFVIEDMEDQFSFLGAFEFLDRKGKWEMATDLLRGIAMETRRQIDLATNALGKPFLIQLAVIADEAANAISDGRYDDARILVRRWREVYLGNATELR